MRSGRARAGWLAGVGLGLLLGACEARIPESIFACERDEDCPPELVCRTNVGRCFATQSDAGPRADAGE